MNTLCDEILPVHPHPLPDELLSSWLTRLAHSNTLKAHSFCAIHFGRDRQVWNRDIDSLAPEWILQGLHDITGITVEKIFQLTLKSYESILFENHSSYGKNPLILPQGIYHRTRRLHGMQFCPICLATDPHPYFRKFWRLAFYTECHIHHIFMHDSCPACDAPVIFFRGDIGYKNKLSAHATDECHVCQKKLTHVTTKNAYWPDWSLAVTARSLFLTTKTGWSCKPLPKIMYSHILFAVFRQFSTLLISKSIKVNFPIALIEKNFGITMPPLTKSISFEFRRIQERHRILVAAVWLLMEWPKRFQETCTQWNRTASRITRDMNPPPYMLHQAIKNI